MKVSLSFSFRDIWSGIRYSFSFKKLWTQLQGLVIGAVLYSVFAYLALMVSGLSLKEIWESWRFIPLPFGESFNFIGKILLAIGVILFVISNYIYAVAVGKITFEQLKGDEFFEVGEAFKFARRKGWPVITAPLSILFVIVFILLLGVILGLFGKIPFVGEIILLIFAIPAIVMCFFLVYLFFAFLLSWILSPAVVSSSESDTFDTLFEVFSTLNEQPFRFVLYQVYTGIIALFTSSFFAWALGRAAWIMDKVLSISWLMGDKFRTIVTIGKYYLPSSPVYYLVSPFLNLLGVSGILNAEYVLPHATVTAHLVGFFFGIGFYIMIFLVLAQFINSWTVGTLISYLVIVKKKDDLDLLELKKEEPNKVDEEQKQESGGEQG
ncbi:MAG: hypothetical protein ABIM42_06320 [candidate division WOR-3 bacterium]